MKTQSFSKKRCISNSDGRKSKRNNERLSVKIIKHGNSVIFHCSECECKFSEVPKNCYSSLGEDGAHYCAVCPECSAVCYTTDKEQEVRK